MGLAAQRALRLGGRPRGRSTGPRAWPVGFPGSVSGTQRWTPGARPERPRAATLGFDGGGLPVGCPVSPVPVRPHADPGEPGSPRRPHPRPGHSPLAGGASPQGLLQAGAPLGTWVAGLGRRLGPRGAPREPLSGPHGARRRHGGAAGGLAARLRRTAAPRGPAERSGRRAAERTPAPAARATKGAGEHRPAGFLSALRLRLLLLGCLGMLCCLRCSACCPPLLAPLSAPPGGRPPLLPPGGVFAFGVCVPASPPQPGLPARLRGRDRWPTRYPPDQVRAGRLSL